MLHGRVIHWTCFPGLQEKPSAPGGENNIGTVCFEAPAATWCHHCQEIDMSEAAERNRSVKSAEGGIGERG